jgi:predicted DNA-binding protein (MmcQ/YjbR family)
MTASRGSAPLVLIYKVMGKMFAILALRGEDNVILKCDPHLGEVLREKYTGVGHRSHLDRRFWISVDLNSDVPSEEIWGLATHSYARASHASKRLSSWRSANRRTVHRSGWTCDHPAPLVIVRTG